MNRLGAFRADEFLIEPAVEVGQPVRVDAHLVQNRGMQMLDVEAIHERRADLRASDASAISGQ